MAEVARRYLSSIESNLESYGTGILIAILVAALVVTGVVVLDDLIGQLEDEPALLVSIPAIVASVSQLMSRFEVVIVRYSGFIENMLGSSVKLGTCGG